MAVVVENIDGYLQRLLRELSLRGHWVLGATTGLSDRENRQRGSRWAGVGWG